MEKHALKMSMMQLTPALPDAYEFSRKIETGIGLIDENPDCNPFEIPGDMLELWCAPEDEVQAITDRLKEFEDSPRSPNLVSSLIVFAHLYVRYYRKEDFGSFENFINTYGRYQTMLNSLIRIKSESVFQNPPHRIKLFDLDNLDANITAVK